MIAEPLTQQEITNRGLAILLRELGPAKTWSFLRQFTAGSGDYTAERQNQLDNLTVDDLLKLLRETPTKPQT